MIFPGPITCHDLKNLEDGWSLLNVFETPEFQACISKSLTTQTFHLIALPASLPQNVSHTKSIMLPTKCLFSRWSCFCSWSHHSPSPGSEPQSSLNVPSLDSHREIHRFSQLYFCSSNTLITVRSLLTSWCLDPPWNLIFSFFVHPVASSHSGSGKLKPYHSWVQNVSMLFTAYWKALHPIPVCVCVCCRGMGSSGQGRHSTHTTKQFLDASCISCNSTQFWLTLYLAIASDSTGLSLTRCPPLQMSIANPGCHLYFWPAG